MALRPVLVGLALCALALAACDTRSRVGRDEPVTIAGVVHAPDGSPLAGRPVQLVAGGSTGEDAAALLTLGLACVGPACDDEVRDTATGDDGAFRFDLLGEDTQSTFGEAVLHTVTANAAPSGDQVSGPSVAARFFVQTAQMQVPALQLVDPKLTLSAAADGTIAARWTPTAPAPYRLTFEGAEVVPVWRVDTAAVEATVDPRLLEDTVGRAVVAGQKDEGVPGSEVGIEWRSPGIGYAGGAGAPPSRGAECVSASGDELGAPYPACGFTDGDLLFDEGVGIPCDDEVEALCTSGTGVVVTLREPVPAELVIVRGCAAACPIDVSDDGTTFRPVEAAGSPFAAIPLDGRVIRAVRVTAPPGPGQATLREISVWGPRPAQPALREPESSLADRFSGGVDDGTRQTILIVVAALLVALTGAAAGFVAGRRRVGVSPPPP